MGVLHALAPRDDAVSVVTGLLAEPVLLVGYDGEPRGRHAPEAPRYDAGEIIDYLSAHGVHDVLVLDSTDARGNLRYDMSVPVPETEHDRYGLVVDLGLLEFSFAAGQSLHNCLRMVRPGGCYLRYAPVNGLDPDTVVRALEADGFDVEHLRYTTPLGRALRDPKEARDVTMWLIGRKKFA